MPTLRLHVIPEPDEDDARPVFVRKANSTGPAATDGKQMSLLCGGCDAVLISGVKPEMLANVILKCPQCGSLNESEVHHH
jgi:hypothetical protein